MKKWNYMILPRRIAFENNVYTYTIALVSNDRGFNVTKCYTNNLPEMNEIVLSKSAWTREAKRREKKIKQSRRFDIFLGGEAKALTLQKKKSQTSTLKISSDSTNFTCKNEKERKMVVTDRLNKKKSKQRNRKFKEIKQTSEKRKKRGTWISWRLSMQI